MSEFPISWEEEFAREENFALRRVSEKLGLIELMNILKDSFRETKKELSFSEVPNCQL